MCKFACCACMDHCCWSLQTKAQFLTFWTILHALLGTLCLLMYPLSFQKLFLWGFLSVLMVHLIAGIMMFIALIHRFRILFLIGLISSCLMPLVYAFTIYLPIVHIIFVVSGCRFYRKKMADICEQENQ